MSDDWKSAPPALGEVMVRLMALRARLLRIEAAQQLERAASVRKLVEKIRG